METQSTTESIFDEPLTRWSDYWHQTPLLQRVYTLSSFAQHLKGHKAYYGTSIRCWRSGIFLNHETFLEKFIAWQSSGKAVARPKSQEPA
jgi:hypothetical protein